MPGGNFPTMRAIAAWEQQFQKPVVTTNQAALWAMMGVMKMATPLPGLGLGCRTFSSCISKRFGGFCSRLLKLRTGKLSSAFRLHGFADVC